MASGFATQGARGAGAHSDVRSHSFKIFQGEISFKFIRPYHLTEFLGFGRLFLVYMFFVGGLRKVLWPMAIGNVGKLRMLEDKDVR